MADEGLTFHPSPYDPPLGYAGFDVELGDDPSARYFDAVSYTHLDVYKRQHVHRDPAEQQRRGER